MAPDRDPPRRPLLAGGEKLKTGTDRGAMGGKKYHPVTIDEAFRALRPQALALAHEVRAMPDAVCGRHLVFEAMLHPNYIANAYHPVSTFAEAGVYVVGTRRAWAPYRTKAGEANAPTKSLLIAGARDGIANLAARMAAPPEAKQLNWNEVREFRKIGLTPASCVVRKIPDALTAGELITWEAVLSPIGRSAREISAWGEEAFEKFVALVQSLDGAVDADYRRIVDGLTFVPVLLDKQGVASAARFNLLRAIRPMPKIRPVRPMHRSVAAAPAPPTVARPLTDVRVAIFDGGVTESLPQFAPYVVLHNLTSEPPTDDALAHGSMVAWRPS